MPRPPRSPRPGPDRRHGAVVRRAVAAVGVALGLTAALLGTAPEAGPAAAVAAPPPAPAPGAPDAPPPPLGPLPQVAPGLAGVAVTSPTHAAAARTRDRTRDDLAAATELEAAKGTEILVLTVREEELTARIATVRARAERWEQDIERLRRSLRDVAVSSYMSGAGTGVDPLRGLDTERFDAEAKEDVAVNALARRQLTELATAQRGARRNRNDERISTAVREGVRQGIADGQSTRAQAGRDRERLSRELVAAVAAVEEESRLATVVGGGFPLVVLDAYWKAAEAMRLLDPACGITWWALAGIGRVESGHGTHAGSEVRADGTLTRPIIGIPLTGAGGTAHIGDSDGGLIDGDVAVDRAAGPMQFIPQTWARWGGDGNGDGRRDIQNLYDAAAGAAAYLCAGGPVTDDAGLSRAYFSYNHSLDYVASVLAGAKRYALEVPIPPVGG